MITLTAFSQYYRPHFDSNLSVLRHFAHSFFAHLVLFAFSQVFYHEILVCQEVLLSNLFSDFKGHLPLFISLGVLQQHLRIFCERIPLHVFLQVEEYRSTSWELLITSLAVSSSIPYYDSLFFLSHQHFLL